MELHFDAIGRNKDAVSFKEIEHKAVSCYYTAAVDTKKRMEGILFRLKGCEFPVYFCIKKESLDLEILAAAQELARAAVPVSQDSHRLSGCRGSFELSDFQALIDI